MRALLVRHGAFGCLLAVAVWLRVVAIQAYPSVLWFGDSITYLRGGLDPHPSVLRPSGYSLLLWALKPFHSLIVVVAVQHTLGVLVGVMVYALVQRTARARWPERPWLPGAIGTAVAIPVLLDAYQIELEHLLMADTLFGFLLVASVVVALWRRPPSWWTGALAGLLLGCAAVVRSAGLPLVLVLLVCLVLRHGRWWVVPAVAAALAWAAPVAAYMNWFHSEFGVYGMTRTTPIWLYGRTASFADCSKLRLRPDTAALCPRPPVDARAAPGYRAVWSESVLPKVPGGMTGDAARRLAGEFAWTAIRTQPGDYAGVVARDTMRAFAWKRRPYPTPWTAAEYEFPQQPRVLTKRQSAVAHAYGGRTAEQRVIEPYAGRLRGYQGWAFLPGTVLGALVAAGLAGTVARVRRLGGPVLLPWSMGLALLVIPAATVDFDYRYVLPAVPLAALAAGLACVPERHRSHVSHVHEHQPERLITVEDLLAGQSFTVKVERAAEREPARRHQ